MARAPKATPAPGWVALGGSSRRYRNTVTGEELSREGYEKRYGSLAKRGATSFKAAAKATPEAVRLARPAVGRPSARTRASASVRSLGPLKGKLSRPADLPFHAYKPFEDESSDAYGEFEEQLWPDEDAWHAFIAETNLNKKLDAVMFLIEYKSASGEVNTKALANARLVGQLPSFQELISILYDKLYDGDQIIKFTAVLLYQRKYFEPSRRPKRKLKTRKIKRKAKNRAKSK